MESGSKPVAEGRPDMATMRSPGKRLRASEMVSMPSFPGMKMSVTMTSAGHRCSAARASWPFADPRTSKPSCSSAMASRARKSSLSSTRRMRAIFL